MKYVLTSLRTIDAVQEDIAAWTDHHNTAHRDLDLIRDERRIALLEASLDDIVAFDARLARADAAADQAAAKIQALRVELDALEKQSDLDEREANLVRAREIADEVAKLEADYVAKAKAVASVLRKLDDLDSELVRRNAKLPPFEPYVEARSSLLRSVVLPAPLSSDTAIWHRQSRQFFSPYADTDSCQVRI